MTMQGEGNKHGQWNDLWTNRAAQMILLVVVVVVLTALAAKYIW